MNVNQGRVSGSVPHRAMLWWLDLSNCILQTGISEDAFKHFPNIAEEWDLAIICWKTRLYFDRNGFDYSLLPLVWKDICWIRVLKMSHNTGANSWWTVFSTQGGMQSGPATLAAFTLQSLVLACPILREGTLQFDNLQVTSSSDKEMWLA